VLVGNSKLLGRLYGVELFSRVVLLNRALLNPKLSFIPNLFDNMFAIDGLLSRPIGLGTSDKVVAPSETQAPAINMIVTEALVL
jgi:hypothetical protein